MVFNRAFRKHVFFNASTAYPEGWKNIVALAEEKKVKLGLWGAAMPLRCGLLRVL